VSSSNRQTIGALNAVEQRCSPQAAAGDGAGSASPSAWQNLPKGVNTPDLIQLPMSRVFVFAEELRIGVVLGENWNPLKRSRVTGSRARG
jgi:hypothetical protein